jgi:hypothetical protein
MSTPFKDGYRISQVFAARPDFYKKFGFAGHEGLDLVSLGNWDVYAVEDGEVVRDVEDPRLFDGYGNLIVIWNRENRRAWWYAHNEENAVHLGQTVKKGDRISRTGLTGNTSGKHLHLAVRYSDENRNPINTNNGYKGFVDPLPLLVQLNKGGFMPEATMQIDAATFSKLVGNSEKWDKTVKYVEVSTHPDSTPFEDVQRVVAGLKSRVTDLQNQANTSSAEVINRLEQVSRVKDQLINEINAQKALLTA